MCLNRSQATGSWDPKAQASAADSALLAAVWPGLQPPRPGPCRALPRWHSWQSQQPKLLRLLAGTAATALAPSASARCRPASLTRAAGCRRWRSCRCHCALQGPLSKQHVWRFRNTCRKHQTHADFPCEFKQEGRETFRATLHVQGKGRGPLTLPQAVYSITAAIKVEGYEPANPTRDLPKTNISMPNMEILNALHHHILWTLRDMLKMPGGGIALVCVPPGCGCMFSGLPSVGWISAQGSTPREPQAQAFQGFCGLLAKAK